MASSARAAEPARQLPIAPLHLLSLVLLIGLAGVVLTTVLAMRGPWLGLTLTSEAGGRLMVERVYPRGPAAGQLQPGQELIALRTMDGYVYSLRDHDPALEPHTLPTFAAYNRFLGEQGRLHQALQAELVVFQTDQGSVSVRPAAQRPLHKLPMEFWLFHLFGLIALTISVAVWVFRRGEWPPRFLAMSGIGFYIATAAHSVWIGRELALPAGFFDALLRINHLGLTLLLGTIIALLAHYPRPLPSLRGLTWVLVALLLYQINENLQLFDLPWHTFYLPILLAYASAAILAMNQWRLSRHDPVNRASLKWIFLSVFLSMGVGVVVYFLPTLLGYDSDLSQIFLAGFGCTLYVGFALGVLRYRLFDLDHWWFLAWLWFFGGIAVIALDLALVAFLGLGHVEAVGLAVLIVAWGYLPLRNWIWRQLTGRSRSAVDEALPALAEDIVRARGSVSADAAWEQTLRALFHPLSVERVEVPAERPAILASGAEMRVPGLGGNSSLCLHHADGGSRLFSTRDRKTVASLLNIARRLFHIREAEAQGARGERARIIRDLHDDVGGRVLALIHSAQTERQADLARKALGALRDTMEALDDKQEICLEDALLEWHEEAEQRAEAAGVQLVWENASRDLSGWFMTPRRRINLRRVMDEALTNALRHARPTSVCVRVEDGDGILRCRITNDGLPETLTAAEQLRPGRGLHHMKTRVGELGGRFETRIVGIPPHHCMEVLFQLPIEG
ncbi:hypothetical protein [Natronospira bacteriovora]|uniref:histidine kinase n=1 Tax=Natronospira bacteriovora TaxID=3069753 RepID=A0ABU0WC37_9GAMM|nr:hypothetical protein [Natronospira sp. AB-CW4]MDQ2070500.1 hypothetical protein [Natronospira sp. AB-CW4]